MRRRGVTFDATVRKLGRALPDVEEGTTYGSPALKRRGRMFACMAVHKSAEPGTLIVRIGFDKREELLAADPAAYYLAKHYLDHPVVLVRLARVDEQALKELLLIAWRFAAPPTRARRAR